MLGRLRIWFVLVFLTVVAGIAAPGFWEAGNLINIAQQSAVTAILGVGLTFVIIAGGIDLSVGAVLALAGVLAAMALVRTGSAVVATATGIAAGAALGFVNGAVTTLGRIPPFITTLGMMLVARSAAKVVTDSSSIAGLPPSFLALASAPLGVPMVVWVVLALYPLAHFVLTRTKLGRYSFAIGGNETAAWLSGVPVGRYKVYGYVLSGALAGLAAVLLTARLNAASPLTGEMYELYAITAAVIGGVSLSGGEGRVMGTLVGALIMAVLRNALNALNVPSAWEGVVVGAVVVVAAVVDSASHGAGRVEGASLVSARTRRVLLVAGALSLLGGAIVVRASRESKEVAAFTIAFLPKGVNSPFWLSLDAGAREEAKRWGAEVITRAPDRETDVDAQFQIIENMIERKVDAVLLAPCGAKEILPALAKLNAAGIPVVIVDSDIDRAQARALGVTTLTYVGSDNEAGGRMAADLLAKEIGAEGEVAIVQGTPGHESTDARQRGFEGRLRERFPNVRVVAVQAANAERARAFSVAQNLLEAHPGLKGLFAANDEMAMGTIEAVDAAGKLADVVVVGFDAAPDAVESIKAGRIRGSIAQYPSEMGRLGAEAALRFVKEKRAPEPVIHTKLGTVTRASLERGAQ